MAELDGRSTHPAAAASRAASVPHWNETATQAELGIGPLQRRPGRVSAPGSRVWSSRVLSRRRSTTGSGAGGPRAARAEPTAPSGPNTNPLAAQKKRLRMGVRAYLNFWRPHSGLLGPKAGQKNGFHWAGWTPRIFLGQISGQDFVSVVGNDQPLGLIFWGLGHPRASGGRGGRG